MLATYSITETDQFFVKVFSIYYFRKDTFKPEGFSLTDDNWTLLNLPVSNVFPDSLLNEEVDDKVASGVSHTH